MSVRQQVTIFRSENRACALDVCGNLLAAGLDAYVEECSACGYTHVKVALVMQDCKVIERPVRAVSRAAVPID